MHKINSLILVLIITVITPSFAEQIEIEIGEMIDRVIAGEDFSGKDIILTGIVLAGGGTDSGLINLGTKKIYNSGSYDNFASIYETEMLLREGSKAKILVHIESSELHRINSKDFVIIETLYKKCIKCTKISQ
ncbi:hypothetical protein DSCW_17690 [Desulfosarcina widdelii]|uniref:Uncharacterized protein n=1 Tax=Desulfosarcina widdelii TaxID=947919 RepID=A0A5K7YX54_9BACT|nr:hypothetical protein [Desulfosarcina widdelii]BBO74352.1 hypothetical protein DSCW_17690 [Desulfosarcina widdelii]